MPEHHTAARMKDNKFDFNTLYKAVFKSSKKKFDSERDYYTILLDFPHLPSPFMDKGKDYFGSLIEKIKLHVPDDAIEEVHVGQEESSADLQNRLRKIKDIVGDLDFNLNGRDQPRCNFIIMLHLNDAQMSLEPLDHIIGVLKQVKADEDEVCLILTMPARMTGGEELLHSIAKLLPLYVTPFIFSVYDSAFRRHALLDSVGAAIILSSSVDERKVIRENMRINARNVENYIYALSEEGQRSFQNEPPIQWMTMYCQYHDTKHDFLIWYCEQLRLKAACIDDNIIMDLATHTYDTIHIPREKRKSINVLQRALNMIPLVDKTGTVRETNTTLDLMFSRLYGAEGVKTVDFSLKATLSMLGSTIVEDGIAKGARTFLSGIGSYNCDDVYTTAVDFLQNYIITIQNDRNQRQKALEARLHDEHELSLIHGQVLPDFIERYIELYDVGKKEDFWQDVLSYIVRRPPDCEEILAHVAQRKVILASINAEFLNSDIKSSHSIVAIPSKKPDEIIEACNNEEFCTQIGMAFDKTVAEGKNSINMTGNCSTIFALDIIPNTYTEFPIHFTNDTYSIEGIARNGQYLIYLEMGES